MKKLILALLIGLLAVPAIQAAQASQEESKGLAVQAQDDEVKVSISLSVVSGEPEICRICHDQLEYPIHLPCTHSSHFCTKCLLPNIIFQANRHLQPSCPVCTRSVVDDVQPQAVADPLPAQNVGEFVVELPEDVEVRRNRENQELIEETERAIEELRAPALERLQMARRLRAHVFRMRRALIPESQRNLESFGVGLVSSAVASAVVSRFKPEGLSLNGQGLVLLPSMLVGAMGLAAYRKYYPEIMVEIEETKDFIKRNKTRIGALATLASLGLIGKKVLALRK